MKKNILFLVLFFLVILEGYFLLISKAVVENKRDGEKVIVESNQINDVPYCFLGHCPTFYSMDITKGEGQNYSVVEQPTHMTKGVGQIWVIDGKPSVIFKSKTYTQVGVEESLDKDGFYITYMTGDNLDLPRVDKVKFVDGVFEVFENIEYEPKNDFYRNYQSHLNKK